MTRTELASLTTLRVGGPALHCVRIHTLEELETSLEFARKSNLPWLMMGRGSNLLIDDRGFAGVVVVMAMEQQRWEAADEGLVIQADAGTSLAALAIRTARNGYSGLEFAAGIPGSLGGGVVMNASAHGHSVSDVITQVQLWHPDRGSWLALRQELLFEYRRLVLPPGTIVLGAQLKLSYDPGALARLKAWQQQRRLMQPWGVASAGCFFKNPIDHGGERISAGALIERAGMKGYCVGQAAVSAKHANFLMNLGGATAQELLTLAREVREEVHRCFGYWLEQEVHYIPYGGLAAESHL